MYEIRSGRQAKSANIGRFRGKGDVPGIGENLMVVSGKT